MYIHHDGVLHSMLHGVSHPAGSTASCLATALPPALHAELHSTATAHTSSIWMPTRPAKTQLTDSAFHGYVGLRTVHNRPAARCTCGRCTVQLYDTVQHCNAGTSGTGVLQKSEHAASVHSHGSIPQCPCHHFTNLLAPTSCAICNS